MLARKNDDPGRCRQRPRARGKKRDAPDADAPLFHVTLLLGVAYAPAFTGAASASAPDQGQAPDPVLAPGHGPEAAGDCRS